MLDWLRCPNPFECSPHSACSPPSPPLPPQELKCESEEERQGYEELQAQLLAAHPTHLPLLLERLQRAQGALQKAAGAGAAAAPEDAARLQARRGASELRLRAWGAVGGGAARASGAAQGRPRTSRPLLHCSSQAAVLTAADAVVSAIDSDQLAIWLARKCAEEGPGAAARKKGAAAAALLRRWACGCWLAHSWREAARRSAARLIVCPASHAIRPFARPS